MQIKISEIKINPGRRDTQQRNVEELARSIAAVGLMNPITVTQDNTLIAGLQQICEHAWEMEGSYNRGVSGPIALLRKGIEPDISNPCYIETIPRIGYRFTAYRDETCDDCSSSVGLL